MAPLGCLRAPSCTCLALTPLPWPADVQGSEEYEEAYDDDAAIEAEEEGMMQGERGHR